MAVPAPDPERYYTSPQVAGRIPCSIPTLYRMLAGGTAPPSVKLGRYRRFPKAEFERWLAERKRFVR